MKKWIWVMLLLLVAVGLISSHEFLTPTRVNNSTDVVAIARKPISTPQVSQEQLLAHVKQLNVQRYTPAERDRARTYISQALKKLGWLPKLESFQDGVNIFAQHQGTDPEAGAILIAAHYDTVLNSPGADDNASGVAVVLEVARLFTRSTPRTLQLAFFDQEEQGLLGSQAFAKNKAHLQNLQGVVVLDMLGYACYTAGCQKYPKGLPFTPPTNKGDFLAVVGDMEHLPLLNAFGENDKSNLLPVLTLPVPLKGMLMPDVLRSDHAPFWYRGVGAVLVTDTANLRTPYYHQPSDRLTNIEASFFTKAAQIVIDATTKLLDGDRLETQPSASTQ